MTDVATNSNPKSVHDTTSGTTADVVTISSKEWSFLAIANRADVGGPVLWVKAGADNNFAAEENGSDFVLPQQELIIDRPGPGVVSVVSTDDCPYSVYGVSAADVVDG